jgi:hypothetical protein
MIGVTAPMARTLPASNCFRSSIKSTFLYHTHTSRSAPLSTSHESSRLGVGLLDFVDFACVFLERLTEEQEAVDAVDLRTGHGSQGMKEELEQPTQPHSNVTPRGGEGRGGRAGWEGEQRGAEGEKRIWSVWRGSVGWVGGRVVSGCRVWWCVAWYTL